MAQNNPWKNAQAQFQRVVEGINLDPGLCLQLSMPQRLLEANLAIRSDDGSIKTFRAWRSQFNNALGPCKGGIRFHEQVDRDEVRALSMWMTWKTSVLNLPLGGGKGGISVNPKKLSLRELEELSREYIRQFYKYLGPTQDVSAPDVNTNAQIMAWMVDEYNTITGQHAPGFITGKPVEIGGSQGRDVATALGSFIVLKELMKTDSHYQDLQTVSVSGKGNAGGNFLRYLHEDNYDWKVVCVSDSSVAIYNEQGIDLAKLLSHIEKRTSYRDIKDLGEQIDKDRMHQIEADLLVPAALEGQIHAGNVSEVKARVILELANGPVTAEAEPILEQQKTLVIPDILANAGGVTVSYFEQVQNNQNYYWAREEVVAKLEKFMRESFAQIWKRMQEKTPGLQTMRDYAYAIAIERVAAAMKCR